MSSIEQPGTLGATELSPLNPGTLFHGRYRVRQCLGTGGMGAIYEVVHHETERRCVLKTMLGTLLTDPDMRARFRLEATVTANVESDHIVDVYDAGIDESTGLPFLVMEYLRGETLASRLRSGGPLQPTDALRILSQASLALDRTHAAGIVHRDLKPENLFITQRDDGTPHLKLLDFGIAKIVAQSTNVNTTRSFGTPLYMSPEQIRGDGDIDGRADLYALGQIAYTLLVGHAYFEPEIAEHASVYPLLLKVMQGTAAPASERAREHGVVLPAAFDAWFTKATHANVGLRFDTAAEQIEALSATLTGSSATETVPAVSVQATPVGQPGLSGASNRDVLTFTGISKSGNHALRDAGRSPSLRSAWLLGLLGVVLVAFFGLYLQWKRAAPSEPLRAVTATEHAPLPSSPASAESIERAAQPKAAPPREAAVAARDPSVTAPETGSARQAPPQRVKKRLSSPSRREPTVLPSADPRPASVRVAPSTTPYDPSDIR